MPKIQGLWQVTPCRVLSSQELHRNSLLFTSLQNKITSYKSRQFTPHHYTSHHITYLHSIPTCIPLLVTTSLTLFLNLFSWHGKDASKLAGNWFQLLMVLFTKEYLPTSEEYLLISEEYLPKYEGIFTNIWMVNDFRQRIVVFSKRRHLPVNRHPGTPEPSVTPIWEPQL